MLSGLELKLALVYTTYVLSMYVLVVFSASLLMYTHLYDDVNMSKTIASSAYLNIYIVYYNGHIL